MKKFTLHHQYKWRLALRSGLAVAAAMLAGMIISPPDVLWGTLAALLAVQTSKGTPAHQGLLILFKMMLTVIAGFLLHRYVVQREWLAAILMIYALIFCVILMLREPERYQSILKWAVPPVMMIVSTLWAGNNEMVLANRLLLILTGGVLGILCSILVLPVVAYSEFRQGLSPLISALIDYSHALKKYLQSDDAEHGVLDKSVLKIEAIMQSHRNEYPEWVFETGFNRNFRSSFRYVLVQLERITEAFFSLDYHARQQIDPELLAPVASHFALVVEKNAELLMIMRAFFAGEYISKTNENFTSDITDVQNSLRSVLPGSVELLDMSSDYVDLAALSRDLLDIREMVLAILAGLPLDELSVSE